MHHPMTYGSVFQYFMTSSETSIRHTEVIDATVAVNVAESQKTLDPVPHKHFVLPTALFTGPFPPPPLTGLFTQVPLTGPIPTATLTGPIPTDPLTVSFRPPPLTGPFPPGPFTGPWPPAPLTGSFLTSLLTIPH